MKVITLNQRNFDEACAQLAVTVVSSGFVPDLIVGIASGGVLVAEAISREAKLSGIVMCAVTCRRNSTSLKEGLGLGRFAKSLPRWLSDYLRIFEHQTTRLSAARGRSRRTVLISPEGLAGLKMARRILVVDDAVDSGSTLLSVVDAIREHIGDIEIRSAVIAVTLANALVVPDYSLYRSVLVRFPWSADAI